MKRALLVLVAGLSNLLGGCLEVEQHPAWKSGEYNGKPDLLQHQTYFHNDRLSWMGAIINRNLRQDEYNKMRP
jgi:hypothetical protein